MGSQSAAQAAEFFREVERDRQVWAVRDDGGFPAPMNGSGERAMPFWSLATRALRIIETCPAYAGLRTVAIPVQEWTDRWLPDLGTDALRIGVNWSGPRARGYDFTVAEVLTRLTWAEGAARPR